MGDEDLLLPDEEAICQGPDEIILTSDGWLATKHKHGYEGLTQLHRMLNVSKIKEIEYLQSSFRDSIRALVFIIFSLGSLVFILSPFSWGIDAFVNGFDSQPHYRNVFWDGYIFSEFSYAIFFAFLLPFAAVAISSSNGASGALLRIHHEYGTMEFKQEPLNKIVKVWIGSLLFSLFFNPENKGIANIDGETGIFLLLIFAVVIWNFTKKELFPHKEENEDATKSEIKQVALHEFKRELAQLLGGTGDENEIKTSKIYEILKEEIDSLKNKINSYEDLLEQLLPQYNDIYYMPSARTATGEVGQQTEALLRKRLTKIFPKRKNEPVGKFNLAGYQAEIKKHDKASTGDILAVIDTIRTLRNYALHASDAAPTDSDFLVALEKFFLLVLWHFENPPQPIGN